MAKCPHWQKKFPFDNYYNFASRGLDRVYTCSNCHRKFGITMLSKILLALLMLMGGLFFIMITMLLLASYFPSIFAGREALLCLLSILLFLPVFGLIESCIWWPYLVKAKKI